VTAPANPSPTKVWLDSVKGTEAEAQQRATSYGEAMAGPVVSVEHVRDGLFYLFLEAT
jgi:hypothetical protein